MRVYLDIPREGGRHDPHDLVERDPAHELQQDERPRQFRYRPADGWHVRWHGRQNVAPASGSPRNARIAVAVTRVLDRRRRRPVEPSDRWLRSVIIARRRRRCLFPLTARTLHDGLLSNVDYSRVCRHHGQRRVSGRDRFIIFLFWLERRTSRGQR